MTTYFKLIFCATIVISLASCGGEADAPAVNEGEEEVAPSTENTSTPNERTVEETSEAPVAREDYHITLNKGGEELTSGMGKGKVRISDVFLCTVNDWKMKILTEEYSPAKMVGNEYHAHIISKDYNSFDCQCQIEKVTGTGEVNSTGERVQAEGTIKCDGGELNGTFAVQLIEQKVINR